MRIVHLSDFHVGAHKEALFTSLKTHIQALKPDVILATGDFADQPKAILLEGARQYLSELVKFVSGASSHGTRSPLIVVPGNHDFGYWGNAPVFRSFAKYDKYFGDLPTSGFYQTERVWIYGFNSSRKHGAGANGEVLPEQLAEFHQAFENAKTKYKSDFEHAFKIIALHHHPLPIRFSSKYSRWVTLMNAGEFLEEMMKFGVDLVVHGHEHVHAKASFGKRLKGNEKTLAVVSVGSALHRNPGSDNNRFNVIKIEPNGEVLVDSYEAQGNIYDPTPADRFVVRNVADSDAKRFNQLVSDKGYKYQRMIIRTEINLDGDAFRTADFLDFKLIERNSDRAKMQQISLPQTSGYIDKCLAWELTDGSEKTELVVTRKDASEGDNRVKLAIEYGRALTPDVSMSLRCQWWAVNAMAMSTRQSNLKYQVRRVEEYTHFPIVDPVEQLTCIVNFPPSYSLQSRPKPFVAKLLDRNDLQVGDRDSEMEQQLRSSIDFDGKKVTLAITKPKINYTYGVRWAIPEDVASENDDADGILKDIVDKLCQFRKAPDREKRNQLGGVLATLGQLVRETLTPQYFGELEIGLMVFDQQERKMVIPAAVRLTRDQAEWLDNRHVFAYGEGIGGKAFKAKETRLYSRSDERKSAFPDYHRHIDDGRDPYAVLLAIPISHPDSHNDVYAVLNCGSRLNACPLKKLGSSGGTVDRENVNVVKLALSKLCYTEFQSIFLS